MKKIKCDPGSWTVLTCRRRTCTTAALALRHDLEGNFSSVSTACNSVVRAFLISFLCYGLTDEYKRWHENKK